RVQRSYWDLVFALRDVQIQRQSVELAKTQLERNKRMVNEGTLAPIELVSVETELEKRSENVLTAIETVTRAENALKQLVLVERVNALSNLAGIPPVAIPPSSPLPGFLLGGYGQSLSNLFSNDFRTFRFGVAFSFPVRNRAAEGQLGRAVAEGRKIGAQRKT